MIHRGEKREERRKKDDRDIPVAAASANRDTIAIGTRDTRRNASVPSLRSKNENVVKKVEEHAKKRPQPQPGQSKLSRRVPKRARGASNLFCPSVCRLLPGRICGVLHRRLFITDDSALRVPSVFSYGDSSHHFSHRRSPYVSK
ncbi:unnamed protein product, partial [Heterotrigona itama]